MKATIRRDSTGGGVNNSRFIRGDTENIRIRVFGQSLEPENFSFKFTAKTSAELPDAEATIQKTSSSGIAVSVISPNVVEAVIAIASSDTELLMDGDRLFYDIQLATISPVLVWTLDKGRFQIVGDITQDNQ